MMFRGNECYILETLIFLWDFMEKLMKLETWQIDNWQLKVTEVLRRWMTREPEKNIPVVESIWAWNRMTLE